MFLERRDLTHAFDLMRLSAVAAALAVAVTAALVVVVALVR